MLPLDPREQQAEQRRRITAQEAAQTAELAKILQQHGQEQPQAFTSPMQVAGQWAQALAGRAKQAELGPTYAALNSAGPFGAGPEQINAPAPASDAKFPSPSPEAGAEPRKGTPKAFSPDVSRAIKEGAAAAGVDPNLMAVFAHIESGGDPRQTTGRYKGLMQLSDAEMAEMSGGKGDVFNPQDSTMAAGLIAKRNGQAFEQKMGRKASPFDLYMMHQQGPAGYEAHVSQPDRIAWQSMLSTGEGQRRGEAWAKSAITKNGGRESDTSQQFLNRWQGKFTRLAGGDHGAFAEEAAPTQVAGPGAPPGTAPAGGGPPATSSGPVASAGGSSVIEHGTFVDPTLLPRPPMSPYRSQAALSRAVGMGAISQEQARQSAQDMISAQQPQSMKVPGGSVLWNPSNPHAQAFIPDVQTKAIKIGDVETQQSFWVDSQGRQHVMPSATGAPAPTGPEGPHTSVPSAASDPFPAGGSTADIAAWGERRKVRITGEEETEKSRAQASTKMFNGIYAGLTGAGDNAAHQAQNIGLLREIAPAAFTGTGTDTTLALNRMRDLAGRLGIPTNRMAAAPRELFNQLAARVLADQFSGMKNIAAEEGSQMGRIFKTMLDVEEKANITPNDSLAGVQAKLNMLEQSGKQMMRWADMADDHVTKHGALDPSFMKRLRKDIAESKFENVVPKEEAAPAAPAGEPLRSKSIPAPIPEPPKPAPSHSREDIEAEMRKRGLIK